MQTTLIRCSGTYPYHTSDPYLPIDMKVGRVFWEEERTQWKREGMIEGNRRGNMIKLCVCVCVTKIIKPLEELSV